MADRYYSLEQIQQWHQRMEELAQQPRTLYSKKEAIEALIEPIQTALKSHSYEHVAENLRASGLEISPRSLREYVNRYLKEQKLPKLAGAATTRKQTPKKTAQKSPKSSPKSTLQSHHSAPSASHLPPNRAPDPKSEEIKLAY